jgi:hypothetical protein
MTERADNQDGRLFSPVRFIGWLGAVFVLYWISSLSTIKGDPALLILQFLKKSSTAALNSSGLSICGEWPA